MNKLGFYIAKIMYRLTKSDKYINNYYRKNGVRLGLNCLICSNILTKEPHLIQIGDNVTISTNVSFITHDNSIKLLHQGKTDLFGRIIIGNNCFIGQNSIIMYGCTLADKIIVAAGSCVTKSFSQSNIIIGGNPARIIGTWEEFKKKTSTNAICRSELEQLLENNKLDFLIKRPFN